MSGFVHLRESITFTCNSANVFKWKFECRDLPVNVIIKEIPGKKVSVLKVINVDKSNIGTYRCYSINASIIIESDGQLHLKSKNYTNI